jgi:hypothetical protein
MAWQAAGYLRHVLGDGRIEFPVHMLCFLSFLVCCFAYSFPLHKGGNLSRDTLANDV